jgi:hypothetical protein
MSLNARITSVTSASAASEHTGSFVKIFCPIATTFSRIEFGNSKTSHFLDGYSGDGADKITTSQITGTTGVVAVPAGSYVEGPIAAFRITAGGCLAYGTD